MYSVLFQVKPINECVDFVLIGPRGTCSRVLLIRFHVLLHFFRAWYVYHITQDIRYTTVQYNVQSKNEIL